MNIATEEDLNSLLMFHHNGKPFGLPYKLKLGAEVKLNRKYYFESDRGFRDINNILKYVHFDGYWQSWRYLTPIEAILKKEFSCNQLSMQTKRFMEKFGMTNSVFVGVRRGDYFGNKKIATHYGMTDVEYYKKAVLYVNSRLSDPVFVFFSNDIEWVKNNLNETTLQLKKDAIIYRESGDITDDFEELFVMSACRNAIISNSTFNFWGAWLMDNPKKMVVVPQDWFKDGKPIDIIPDNWIRIP